MSPAATLCNLPVSTGFDSRATRSCASLDWVLNSGLRTRASQLSGPLTLPCDAGVISVCLHDIPVNASLPYDLVLGLDWFNLVRNSAPQLVVHLSSGSLDLRTIGSAVTQSSTASPLLAPVFRANIGLELSASSVSAGVPDVVPAPSSMSSTRGIDVVTSRLRDGTSGQDVRAASLVNPGLNRSTNYLL
ncbi:hypothetical protein MVEN_00723500 [Mycena venus]|uniref:Uncharacterized protein n=1 Tax=Mycena venus TaxID=2733690 RepID=A0A8H7D5S8_9AGAR|nr:hypothetical protein MVEN_00723500 [Mycena venus]